MENAIVLASGMGVRMRPLTHSVPKPLICVNGVPMIETLIEALIKRGVDNIVVVVGYLGYQFEYLKDKYDRVQIIVNEDYEKVNNISSLYVARDTLLAGDCFICEADLFVKDRNVLMHKFEHSMYIGKMIWGKSSDWVLGLDENGRINRIGIGGEDCYNMVGISYFRKNEAKILNEAICKEYGKVGYEKMFWDEVVNKYIKYFDLFVFPIDKESVIEIDSVDELEQIKKMMMKN